MKKNKLLLSIALLLGSMSASAQWEPEGNLTFTPDKVDPFFEVQTGKDGLTYLSFLKLVDEDPETIGNRYADDSDFDYYLQIIDKDGNKLFSNSGKLISHEPTRSMTMGNGQTTLVDSDGNLIYIVVDERNWNAFGAYQSHFAYKLSPTGEFLWETPVDLERGDAYYLSLNIRVIEVEDGYLFARENYVGENNSHLRIDKVSKAGELVWDEPLIVAAGCPFLVPSEGSDFILIYTAGGSLQAQRYTSDKTAVWETPRTLFTGSLGTVGAPAYTAIRVFPDENGGAFVGWHRQKDGLEQSYVSHLLPDGGEGFIPSGDEQGLRVSQNPNMRAFAPYVFYDSTSENLYAAFEEHNSTQSYRSIVLQKISKEGEVLPTGESESTTSLVIEGANQINFTSASIHFAGRGRIALFYQRQYTNFKADNIAVFFDVTGDRPEYLLEDKALIFDGTAQTNYKTNLTVLPLRDHSWFPAFWNDELVSQFGEPLGSQVGGRKLSLPFAPPACPEPTGLNASAVTSASATLAWTADDVNTAWDVRYKPAAAEEWTNVPALNATSYELTGLTENTAYLWQVKAYCDSEGNESEYTGNAEFSTITTALASISTGLNVTLSGHALSILNAKGARIDRVRLYAADGSLRQDFPVQSTGNVLIPISATPKIAIVEVTAGGAKAVFKVVTSDE
jgi:hypothetical protein